MKNLKKCLAAVLFAILLIGICSVQVRASVIETEAVTAQATGAAEYVVGDGVTATFDEGTGEVVFYSDGGTLWRDWYYEAGLSNDAIKLIRTDDASGKVYLPADSGSLFNGLTNLKRIDMSHFDSSNVTSMASMFFKCEALTSLDLTMLDTSNVTDMSYLFYECSSLKFLNLSGLKTSNVKNMEFMFYNCDGLTNLDVSSFDTSNVTKINHMFYECSNLTKLDVSNFNTSGVTEMSGMFCRCSSLKILDLRNFQTIRVKYISSMFSGCTNLIALDLSSFNLTSATSTYYFFYNCNSLRILRTPKRNDTDGIELPFTMYDKEGEAYVELPWSINSTLLINEFTDVTDASKWYYDSVYWAVENGVTSGMGPGTFQPMAKLTRAQTVQFLYNLAGNPDVSDLEAKDFTDVSKNAWYYNAVKWAVANKITAGYGTGTFQPNTTCNRAMIVTFLMNYSKVAGTYIEPTTESDFSDVPAGAWFKKSVDWAVENGITAGYGTGTFSPDVTCNRAMMVTFLKKVSEMPRIYIS